MLNEIKEYFKTSQELKTIHQEIDENTKHEYERILKVIFDLSDLWRKHGDEYHRTKIPVSTAQSISRVNANDFESNTVKNLIQTKPNDPSLRYKYGYVGYENSNIIDLELLREYFENEGFVFKFKYDDYNGHHYFDTIDVGMLYYDLDKYMSERTNTK